MAAYFLGYRIGDETSSRARTRRTRGEGARYHESARDRRQDWGKVATGANEAQHALAEMSLQAKIKSKMALDELVKASAINIDSANGVVTLKGTVGSQAERARAVQLARETAGVKSVADRLVVQ